MTKCTPTPWHYHTKFGISYIIGANGQGLAHTAGLRPIEDEANAALIIKAVNAREKLLDILRRIISDDTGTFTKAYDEAQKLLTELEENEILD